MAPKLLRLPGRQTRSEILFWLCLVFLPGALLALTSYSPLTLDHEEMPYLKPSYENDIVDYSGYAFGVAPGVLPEKDYDHGFDYRREYSPQLATIYSKYLKRPTPDVNEHCGSAHEDYYHGKSLDVDEADFHGAFIKAGQRIEAYERANQEYLASDPRGLNFSAYVYVATLHAKYNELLTKFIRNKKCLNRKQVALNLPRTHIPPNPWKKRKYCELQSRTTLTVHCDLHYPYRRLDGKCNNPIHTNLGSSFHCHRRLMPPDYSDGIHQVRLGVDKRPLPSPRLVTQLLMPDLDLNDPSLSAMHLAWGQMVAHDTFRTIQFLGLAIDCCRLINQGGKMSTPMSSYMSMMDPHGGQLPTPHPECLPITNFPPNKATEMFRQTCLNTVRSVTCNTCSLGPRNQMNVATPVIDLSHIYGGNLLNNSQLLRTYIGGQLLLDFALNGESIMPAISLPGDSDTLDLTPCNPPLKNPMNVGCFRTGDGMRGNQNPFIASLQTLVIRRHNQHAAALSLMNPHWDDERLFQEARRINIAEITRIHYGEYFPLVLGDRLMKYFHLELRDHGYTKYNPHVDPSTIHPATVAAMRFGHSQIRSLYRVIHKHHPKTSFMLKDRFFNMLEVWNGQITPVLRGILSDPAKNIDPYGVIDVKDFLFFNPRNPSIIDLFSINVNRGRDHGVPAYVFQLQYCTGYEVKSWKDLERFMPPGKVKNLRSVYRHYRDIDLFVGGLMEYHLKGARVGPTFACMIGIQLYHWKYGDRFYFEHGGEIGSFSPAQLDEIRKKSTLTGLLCRTTNMKAVQVNAFVEASAHNPKVPCHDIPEIEYELWRESHYLKK